MVHCIGSGPHRGAGGIETEPLLYRRDNRKEMEVDNNYAAAVSEQTGVDPADFLIRRANAYQAYYEMMPLRTTSLPRGPHMQLYRKASYGRLAEMMILDTRQYRTDQPNGDKRADLNEDALDPRNTPARGRAARLARFEPDRLGGDLERPGPAGHDGDGRPGPGRGARLLDGPVAGRRPRADAAGPVPSPIAGSPTPSS